MKGLIHQSHILCDENKDIDLREDLCLLRDVFISNGYPVYVKLVKETPDKPWEVETLKAVYMLVGVQQMVDV